MFHKEMPLTTKNLVRVTSTHAPRAKMVYTVCMTVIRVSRNLGYKNYEGYSGD